MCWEAFSGSKAFIGVSDSLEPLVFDGKNIRGRYCIENANGCNCTFNEMNLLVFVAHAVRVAGGRPLRPGLWLANGGLSCGKEIPHRRLQGDHTIPLIHKRCSSAEIHMWSLLPSRPACLLRVALQRTPRVDIVSTVSPHDCLAVHDKTQPGGKVGDQWPFDFVTMWPL